MAEWKRFLKIKLPVALLCTGAGGLAGLVLLTLALVDEQSINTWANASIAMKLARLAPPNRPPAVIISGGSGALYGLDSPYLETLTGRQVTNVSTQWQLTFYTAEKTVELVRPGDIFVMPLEYSMYGYAAGDKAPFEACYRISHDRSSLKDLRAWGDAFVTCPSYMLLYGMFLKVLRVSLIYEREIDPLATLNEHGDHIRNLPELGRGPNKRHAAHRISAPEGTLRLPRLERLARAIKQRGGILAISFPAVLEPPEGKPSLPTEDVDRLKKWAADHDTIVVSTPETHIFPAECFFDQAHLHRGCTRENTRRYAEALKPLLTATETKAGLGGSRM